MSHLFISEKFYSIQGEGVSTGIPAIFIRLSGCNLLCQSTDWVCDSIDVWRKGVKTAFSEVFTSADIQALSEGAHLVFTGGEPLMHQKKLIEFLHYFVSEIDELPFIEVETNGTITPSVYFADMVSQWNCSPKLANSGETFERRINPLSLGVIASQPNSWFKFVISSEEDIKEIENLFLLTNLIKHKQVILMPAGDNQELLEKNRLMVVELCKRNLFRYSDRLHIVAWNKKTGV